MITEEDIRFLAKMDGISVEAEEKKYKEWRKEARAVYEKQGLEATDEFLDGIFLEVLNGYRKRNK